MLSLCVCGIHQEPWHIVVELEEKRSWQSISSEQHNKPQLDKPCFNCGGEADCWQHVHSGRFCCQL